MDELVDLEALCKIQYGMYVVSACADNVCNAQIATTVIQVTNQPNQVIVCSSKETLKLSKMHQLVKSTRVHMLSSIKKEKWYE